jgi:hypothetical protein
MRFILVAFLKWFKDSPSDKDDPEIFLLHAVLKSTITIATVAIILKVLSLLLGWLGLHLESLPIIEVPLITALIKVSDAAIFIVYCVLIVFNLFDFVVRLVKKRSGKA